MKLHQVPATECFPRQNEEKVRSLSYSGNSNSAFQNATGYINWAVIPLWPLSLPTSTFLREHVISQKIHHSIITESEKANGHYLGSKQYSISLFLFCNSSSQYKNSLQRGGHLNSRKRWDCTKYSYLRSDLGGGLRRSYDRRLSCV